MPKQPSSSGSFTDLYEAMERRKEQPAASGPHGSDPTTQPAPPPPPAQKETVPPPAQRGVQTIPQPRARVHSRTDARKDACVHTAMVGALYQGVRDRRHLASQTFRFQAGELNELQHTIEQIDQSQPGKLSKNDLVRLGVNWLLQD